MADTRLIIDGAGLPHAPIYYHTFPWEPSPAGDLTLSTGAESILNPMTVLTLLDELVKAGTSGTALVVCHAVPQGMLVRIDTGGTHLTQDAVEVIEQADKGLATAKSIRAMPQKSEQEKQIKRNDWQALNERLNLGLFGQWSLDEADQQFGRWFTAQAQRLRISTASLELVITRARAVKALSLDRIELRACDLGTDTTAMAALKRFFGCKKFLAPKCRTAYLGTITVESLPPLTPLVVSGVQAPQVFGLPVGTWQPHRLPGPIGVGVLRPDPSSGDVMVDRQLIHAAQRKFFNGRSFMSISLWEVRPFTFSGSAAAPRTRQAHSGGRVEDWTTQPDWHQVAEVVRSLFMFSGGNYTGRLFPIACLWKPLGSTFPWLAPNEKEYKAQIVTV